MREEIDANPATLQAGIQRPLQACRTQDHCTFRANAPSFISRRQRCNPNPKHFFWQIPVRPVAYLMYGPRLRLSKPAHVPVPHIPSFEIGNGTVQDLELRLFGSGSMSISPQKVSRILGMLDCIVGKPMN